MEKRKLNRITAGFIVLVVMVLILMFSNSLRRSSHITLPEEGSSPGQAEDTNASGGDALTVIAVTPETVQTAVQTAGSFASCAHTSPETTSPLSMTVMSAGSRFVSVTLSVAVKGPA